MAAKMKKDQTSSSRSKKFADDIFKEIKKDEILSSAQKVINSAVNVLEEEIAAGILAAKKIERKVLDLDEIQTDPDDLMNRIRRDTHEAVDLFMDAITALTKQINKLTDKEDSSQTEKTATDTQKKAPVLSMIVSERPLRAGETEIYTGKDEVGNGSDGVYTRIGIQQESIDLFGIAPGVKLQNQQVVLAEKALELSQLSIRHEVKKAWAEVYTSQ